MNRRYLSENPDSVLTVIRLLLSNREEVGEEKALSICAEILSDVAQDSICILKFGDVWDTIDELREDGLL